MRQMDFNAWGIQTGPFASHSANFVRKYFQLFDFHTGGHILLPQRTNNGKGEFTQLKNWMRQMDFNARGVQSGPFAAHLANFVHKYFHLSHCHTVGHFLLPQMANNGKGEFTQLQNWM